VAGGTEPAEEEDKIVQSNAPVVSRSWRMFLRDQQGQDLVEYSLLLAFVCLAGAAMFIGMGQATSGLWTTVNSRLAAANQPS
jgi:Flp pilus assembly pilin Flp